jgi:hypothetical protein
MTLLDFAHEIVDLHYEVNRLQSIEYEYEALQKRHNEQTMVSIRHGEAMMGGILELTLKPGVMDAIRAANK